MGTYKFTSFSVRSFSDMQYPASIQDDYDGSDLYFDRTTRQAEDKHFAPPSFHLIYDENVHIVTYL